MVNAGVFQEQMYRPLYWFGDSKGGPGLNADLSLAQLPAYSDGGRTVTIKLKPYAWSNGEKLTSADVLFWINMEKAERTNYAAYVPGQFPDNVTAATAPDASTVVLTLDAAYSQQWFTYNQLGQITPMPMAWDVTGPGATGTCHTAVSGCAAVYRYLIAQTKNLPTYASNPLWQVVDGPWKLASFNADGHVSFVPNPAYSGPQKASLKKLVLAPFTTDAAEFNVLRSGQTLDVGYLPTQDVAAAKPAGSPPNEAGPNPLSANYTLSPWFLYAINYFPLNFNNPTFGPVFKQLYFRQALQSLVDQDSIIKAAAKGYGVPTSGPVPSFPDSPLVSSLEKQNPYPFDVNAAARTTSRSHGWTVVPGGASTCARPGTGPTDCGAGVKAGQKLAFSLQYASGIQTLATAMQSLKSNAAQVGIQLSLGTAAVQHRDRHRGPLHRARSARGRSRQLGGGWVFAPDYYPTGELLFAHRRRRRTPALQRPKAIDALIRDTTCAAAPRRCSRTRTRWRRRCR